MRFELSAHLYQRLCRLSVPKADGLWEEESRTGPRYYLDAAQLQNLDVAARATFFSASDSWRLLPGGGGNSSNRLSDPARLLCELLDSLAARESQSHVLLGGSLQLEFSCDRDPSAVAGFLAPYFEVRAIEPERRSTQVSVKLWRDGPLFEQAHALWRQLEYGCWASLRDRGVVLSRGEGYGFYGLGEGTAIGRFRYPRLKDGEPVLFLRTAASEPWNVLTDANCTESDIGAARALRAFASHGNASLGAVAIHASCFVLGGRAYLICGEKGTGKTTNLIASLEVLPAAHFLSNDRAYIWCTRTGAEVSGSPHSIPVRLGTFLLNDRLYSHARRDETPGKARGYSLKLDLAGRCATRGGGRVVRSDEEVYFAPSELAALFGKEVVPRAPLGGIIFLGEQPSGRGESTGFVRIAEGLARRWLSKHVMSHYEEASPYWSDLLPPTGSPTSGESATTFSLEGAGLWALTGIAPDGGVWRHFPAASVES